jgi:hypothetical protein
LWRRRLTILLFIIAAVSALAFMAGMRPLPFITPHQHTHTHTTTHTHTHTDVASSLRLDPLWVLVMVIGITTALDLSRFWISCNNLQRLMHEYTLARLCKHMHTACGLAIHGPTTRGIGSLQQHGDHGRESVAACGRV